MVAIGRTAALPGSPLTTTTTQMQVASAAYGGSVSGATTSSLLTPAERVSQLYRIVTAAGRIARKRRIDGQLRLIYATPPPPRAARHPLCSGRRQLP